MSDKNKIILVGAGLAAAAIAAAVLFFLLGREKPPEPAEEAEGGSTVEIDAAVYERKGRITSVSVEGTDVSISSEEGEFSFSVSESSITSPNGASLSAKDLVIGMEIEATVERGIASSIRIKSVPPLAVTSPSAGPVSSLDFNIAGIAYAEGDKVCLSLVNRRTGTVYENGLSAAIGDDRRFSLPVSLGTALDAMPGDMLDASLSICGSGESVSAEWGHYPGLTSKIKVYFLKNSCSNQYYVERVIMASRSPTRAAVEELLKGPNAKEASEGIFTSADPSERVRRIEVESNVVYLDFYPTIVNVRRCSVATLKSQIMKTLSQFPMGKIVITVEGEEENPLN
jgi:hypothetical protein